MSRPERLRTRSSPASRSHALVVARRRRRLLGGVAVAALALAAVGIRALATAPAATHPEVSAAADLWPKLASFRTMVVADLFGGSPDQQLAATTLEGAYNQRQRRNRLYVVWNPDDQTWLHDHVLTGVHWSALRGLGRGATGQLNALLAGYGHDVKGAILINPSQPETINLATTMAGLDDAMVADPDQLTLLHHYGIPVIYSFADRSFPSATAAYHWEYINLFPKTNPADLVIMNPAEYGALRDYIIATKSFVFYLDSTDSAEEPLMNQIISARPVNTPILGYVANEQPDVDDLSSLGYFLNGSYLVDNESDWAAVPSPSRLAQPKPQPVQADKHTVYVSFLVSDGDDEQYDEYQMFDVWSAGTDLGAVPEGWTTAPGMVDYAPSLISWFYRNLPRDSELLSGPSGVGYATEMGGTDLRRFAHLSGEFIRRDSMSTVDFWEPPTQIAAYAKSSGVASISVDAPMAYTQEGRTAVVGQTSGYIYTPDMLLSTIEQDALASPAGKPAFLDPLVDGWTITPKEILAIGQALARWGKSVGREFVFTTPSELALTEEAYLQGSGFSLPRLNAQAVSGAALLKLPPAGQLQGYASPAPRGPSLISNPDGSDGTRGWSDTAGTLTAGTYQGSPDLDWSVPTAQSYQRFVEVCLRVAKGDTYQFSVQVAGSGQVLLGINNGNQTLQSLAVTLTTSYQTITWTAAIASDSPGGGAPGLEVREIGIGPVNVHIKDAAVRLA
jgi:GxGYxY sequence motif in domain of unknown function N-terminal/GxGYxYP putative glycoside hydrolase C-terminal domain